MTEEQVVNTGWEGIMPFLLKAQQAIGAVGKDSRNDFGNFNYASAETIITASREVLHKYDLIVTRNGWRIIREPDALPIVEAVYVLGHKSGINVVCATQYPIVVKGGAMPEDNALNASLTTGLSYFLRDLLLIPRVEVEGCARQDTMQAKKSSGTRSTPKPKVTPKKRDHKSNFMKLVGLWINRGLDEKVVAETCVNILEENTLPTDGTATPTQFEDMCKWVQDKIDNKIDPADIIKP